MCKHCLSGQPITCPNCGWEICEDAEDDGTVLLLYKTTSGDIYCFECGPQFDLVDAGEQLLEGWGEYVDLDQYRNRDQETSE